MFPIIRIRSSQAEAVEYLGTKAKFWYREGEHQMLFKAEERGTGEDWAEKIACALCALLGLPHVRYEMAYDLDQQRPGVVCASFTPPPLALAHGNQLLLARDPAYPAGAGNRYRSRAHTVDAVFEMGIGTMRTGARSGTAHNWRLRPASITVRRWRAIFRMTSGTNG